MSPTSTTPAPAENRAPSWRMPDWCKAVLLLLALVLAWRLATVLLLVFAAMVLAVLLNALATHVVRLLRLPHAAALALVVLCLLALVGGVLFLFGDTVRTQASELAQRLPAAWETLRTRINAWDIAPQLRDWLSDNKPEPEALAATVGMAATSLVALIGNAVLVLVGAMYLAARPHVYRRGLLFLLPAPQRPRGDEVVDHVGNSLERWLLGQLAAMILVGTLIGAGAALIGLPSALVLGLVAGLLEFVPIAGPIVAAIPALLLAATLGWTETLWTLLLFFAVQQIEGNLLMPAIMQRAVALPAAVTLFAVLAFGILFGPLGVLLATPLAVVLMAVAQKLIADA